MSQVSAMIVAFRADASLNIGTGHVMRCLTLADALREQGVTCHFICREHTGHLIAHIKQRGFTVKVLPACDGNDLVAEGDKSSQPAHAAWLGSDWKTDAFQAGVYLDQVKPNWLVLDHYALDYRWEEELQGNYNYNKLLVIDDLADRSHNCDLLLDQNLGRKASDYDGLVPKECVVLAGPQYALLRPEFATLREYSLKRRETPVLKQILITMGGVDLPNATSQVLEALKNSPLPKECRIVVVMGSHAPWLSQVRDVAANMPWPTEVRVDINDMAQVMADSDLAIGAAGSTSWERCCLGLPTLMVVLAMNQQAIADALVEIGAAISPGRITDKEFSQKSCEMVARFITRPEFLEAMSKKAADMTDGRGTEELTRYMWNQ